MPSLHCIPCAVYRAGTSKPLFFLDADLPSDQALRDALLLKVFGSPHPRQVDGIGCGHPLHSKVGIVGPSNLSPFDVTFTYGYVSIREPFIDYRGTCGNTAAAVAPFALLRGLVAGDEPHAVIRILDCNTGRTLTAGVKVSNGLHDPLGSTPISGVSGTASAIYLDFADFEGGVTGSLLPTGRPSDTLVIDGRVVEVTLIDLLDLFILVRAADLGVRGLESVGQLEGNTSLMRWIDELKIQGAALIGIERTLAHPKLALLAPSEREGVALEVRVTALDRIHPACSVSGALAVGASVHLPGSIAYAPDFLEERTRLGHPAGEIELEMRVSSAGKLLKASIVRTARLLLDGTAHVYV